LTKTNISSLRNSIDSELFHKFLYDKDDHNCITIELVFYE